MPKQRPEPIDIDEQEERPSKSQLKREMHALQALGETLIAMKPAERARFPLSDDMLRAIEETSRIRSHEGRRRHMQYVGKLIRKEDLTAIQGVSMPSNKRKSSAIMRFIAWKNGVTG